MKTTQTLRTATKEDFKKGTTLITSEGYEFFITREEYPNSGIWSAKGRSGEKCVFDTEASSYKVKA